MGHAATRTDPNPGGGRNDEAEWNTGPTATPWRRGLPA